MKLFVSVKVHGAMRYINFSEKEQDEKEFEETFVNSFVDKSE